MLTQEQLIAYLDNRLPEAERLDLERELAADPEAQFRLADQQNIDLALRVLFGRAEDHERVKQSIFTVFHGASMEQLQAQVLADTSGASGPPAQPVRRRAAPSNPVWKWLEELLLTFRSPRAAWLAVASLMVLLAASAWLTFRPTASGHIVVGELAAVVGQPTLRNADKTPDVIPSVSTPIHLGDRLETGDADKAEIAFKDGTTLRLGFNTVIEIAESKLETRSPGSAPLRPSEIRLLQGEIWTQVQTLTNARQYAIHTEAATAIARGTEFGVKLLRASARSPELSTQNSQLSTSLTAVLTVKEGLVDFTNALGSVQATAMTESTARADLKPTEPKRLQTLQVMRLAGSTDWHVLSSQLDWPDTAERLSLGGGWAGFKVRDLSVAAAGTNEIRVIQVSTNSPAANAGFKTGDVLIAMEEQALTEASQVSRALLLRSDTPTSLTLRRGNQEVTVTLTARHRSALLAGPNLSVLQAGEVGELTRKWVEEGVTADLSVPSSVGDLTVRGAAENNLGVLLEAGDEMGPAIRAYGRAVRSAPQVPLYRLNLGLALRKIGSFERAAEELHTTVQLAPAASEPRKRLAEVLSLMGNHQEALTHTDLALRLDPDHALWELRAQILSKLRRTRESTEAARKAVEAGPGCPVALRLLAAALNQEGNLAEAERTYRRALEFAPFDPLIHMNLGVLLKEQGMFDAAQQHLRTAIQLQPDDPLAYRNLGTVLGLLGQWGEAEALLSQAAKLAPNDPTVSRDLAGLYFRQRRFPEAEALLHSVLQRSPDDSESYFALAEVLIQSGSMEEGERMCRHGIEQDPTNGDSWTDAARVYLRLLRNRARAEECYRQALKLAPDNVPAHLGLAEIMAMQGKLPEAETLMRRAATLAPDSADVWNGLGEVLRMAGTLDEAVKCYNQAIERSPRSPSPYNNLGIIHAVRGQPADAEKMFRSAVDLAAANPRFNPANYLLNLGFACQDQGKFDDAEQAYREAMGRDPLNGGACNALAWMLADRGLRLDEALQFGLKAVELQPEDPYHLDTLGWVHLKRGEFAEAERRLKQALQLAGAGAAASGIRERLQHLENLKRDQK